MKTYTFGLLVLVAVTVANPFEAEEDDDVEDFEIEDDGCCFLYRDC